MSNKSTASSERPLSPHLQVYRLPYNAVMSITGRAVGIGLSLALTVSLIWLVAVVWYPPLYEMTFGFLNHALVGYLFLLAAFIIFFYIGNGIRHVLWDFVIGVNVKAGEMTGHIVLVVAAVLTLALWFVGR